MKNMKKTTYIWAITLVIAGLLMTSAVGISAEISEKETSLVRELDVSAMYLSAQATRIEVKRTTENFAPIGDGSTIIYDTEYDDYHPTIAGDISGRFFAGFELTSDEIDYYPDFWYSLDNGVTWEEAGYFAESLGAEYPDADANEHGFYATFTAPPATPGATWLVDASDLNDITGYTVDWSPYGITDFEDSLGISCYTFEGEDWNEGGSAKTCYNNYNGADIVGCPVINYPVTETSVAIGWLTGAPDCVNADFAIDEVTDMSYAVYDNSVDTNLLVRKDNFAVRDGDGYHSYVGSFDVGDGVTDIRNPSIEANDDIIIIVAEADGNVVCYYSANGMSTVQESTVEAGAAFPEVMLAPDGTYVCSYIKDGVIYSETSVDGATWGDQGVVADNEVNDRFQSHDLGRGVTGVFGVWEDIRNADIDIYFAEASGVEVPILEIISIAGGIGVTATIKNTGTAAATDVQLGLTVTGGILGFINKNASDTVTSLAIDEEVTIKSKLILGLGPIDIEVTATCAEGPSATKTDTGKVLIIFTTVV